MKLANIFSDNMVFQAEKNVRFFGKGKGCVSITLKNQTYTKNFFGDSWVLELPPQQYGGPYDIKIRLQEEDIILRNVVFGDVFLCAGQSNMQFSVAQENDGKIKDNDYIRYFVSDRIQQHTGQKSADGWIVCKSDAVEYWSALGLHIAENYQNKKDVFVGIVGCFQGASVIRSWIPKNELDETVYVPLEQRHRDCIDKRWFSWNGDSQLYENTFLPIAPFSFKAVIWYQGESDTTVAEGKVYTNLLRKLIIAWRDSLKDYDLPFVVVQICDFDNRSDEGWRSIQQCQQEVSEIIENVQTVTSKDVCEHCDIHPSNKKKLGEKISNILL